eukprot:TRINITY_DN1518_c0_g1_i3.p1 TRINITY_DN1518_c0_g1~~TRINITY_DN1518_c0_g1_i3.p1  ORF type:complete len:138 (+),score=32.76 TRINITY_DN1518_c0_g1_i3:1425-1838(+)
MQAWQALQQLQQADGVAPVSTCLEAIMQGLALQDAATAAAGGAVAAPASQRGRDILAAPCAVRAPAYGAAGVGGGDAAGDSGREVLFERAAAGQGGSCQQAPLGGARLGECREQLGTKFESLCEEVETLKHSVQEEV